MRTSCALSYSPSYLRRPTKAIVVYKRAMVADYAGLINELFYLPSREVRLPNVVA